MLHFLCGIAYKPKLKNEHWLIRVILAILILRSKPIFLHGSSNQLLTFPIFFNNPQKKFGSTFTIMVLIVLLCRCEHFYP